MSGKKQSVTVESDGIVLKPLEPRPTANAMGLAPEGAYSTTEKGNYVLASLDKNGNEIPNSEFTYPAGHRFNKTFANNPKFIIKKKP